MTEENAGAGSGIAGMFNAFVDPKGLAKSVPAKLFWLWPLIIVTIVFVVFGYLMLPFTLQLVDNQIAQQNIPAERLDNARNIGHIIANATVFITPVFLILILMLLSWLVSVTGSIVGMRAKFRDVFSIASACSLISCLQYAANYVVLRTKGDEITSRDQLTPPFGLDIFIPAHGALLAILNFFSIFEIWYLVIFGLTLAYVANSSKGKAFFALTPAWLIPLIFRILGSMFGGGQQQQ